MRLNFCGVAVALLTAFLSSAQNTASCKFEIVAGPASTFSGDGGPASQALLFNPGGLAVDTAENIYIADTHNHRIRKVSRDGIISTIAGSGRQGFSGDGGPALAAELSAPTRLAVAADGTLFVSDTGNNSIRAITADGAIHTVAGNGHPGFDGDGRPAVIAELNAPLGLALDAKGQLFIADNGNARIRRVDMNGTITTVAGNGPGPGNCCYTDDGGPATAAQLSDPRAVAIDPAGNLLIGDTGHRAIRTVDEKGVIGTLAGGPDLKAAMSFGRLDSIAVLPDKSLLVTGIQGIVRLMPGTGTPAVFASGTQLGTILAASGVDRVYVIGSDADVVWRVSEGSQPEIFAGKPWFGKGADGASALGANLHTPMGMATAPDGSLLIADRDNGRVVKLSSDGRLYNVADIAAPEFLAIDAQGVIYVSDRANRLVKKIARDGTVSVFAGGGTASISGASINPLPATQVAMDRPYGLVAHPNGTVYGFVHSDNSRTSDVVQIAPDGSLTTLPRGTFGRVTGLFPYHGLSLHPSGDLLFGADALSDGPFIWRITTSGDVSAWIGGLPQLSQSVHDIASSSSAAYIVDAWQRIAQLTLGGRFVSIFNSAQDEYLGQSRYFAIDYPVHSPLAIATNSAGDLYVSERDLNRILRLKAGTCAPPQPPLIASVVSSANLAPGPAPLTFAPGELITMFGYSLGPDTGMAAAPDSSGHFPFTLGGTRVLFEGVPGAMLYSSARQINAIVPFTMYGRTLIRVQVETDGLASDAYWINMAESSPVVWHDTTLPIVFNQDGTLNSYNNPAAAGSIVIVYATGLGRTVPEGQDGIPAATPYPHPRIALTASTGDILYAGDAPGFVQGLSQINFRAPSTNDSVVFQQGAAMFSVFVYAR